MDLGGLVGGRRSPECRKKTETRMTFDSRDVLNAVISDEPSTDQFSDGLFVHQVCPRITVHSSLQAPLLYLRG